MKSVLTPFNVYISLFYCRYVPQLLAEMAAMRTEELIYLSWTEESSTAFRVTFDEELWNLITEEAVYLYSGNSPKRPTRKTDRSKIIKSRLTTFKEENTELLCEVKSIKATASNLSKTHEQTPFVFPIPEIKETSELDINEIIAETKSVFKEAYDVCRKKATEVLVWLASDSDRVWNPEIPHALPVSYAMKGYSLSTKVMRSMHSEVLQACHDKGITIDCSCFDGQWLRLAVRDEQDRPLTLLQLQKDTFEAAKKATRDEIWTVFSESSLVNDIDSDLSVSKSRGSLHVTCPLYRKLLDALKRKNINEPLSQPDDTTVEVNDRISCLPDEALELLIQEEENGTDIITIMLNGSEQHDTEQIETEDDEGVVEETRRKNMPTSLDDAEYMRILKKLQDHTNQSVAKRWKGKTFTNLKDLINNISTLQKFTHDEMNTIIEATSKVQKDRGITISKGLLKEDKANEISVTIGSGETCVSEKMVKSMMKLKEFAVRKIKTSNKINARNLPKAKLNILYATLIYPTERKRWLNNCPFGTKLNVHDQRSTEIFSYPGFNSNTERLEPMCLDAHHLLVNLRVKVCKDGLKNINKKAWHDVADADRNIISKSLVHDLIDKQSNAFAQKTFSSTVEEKMRDLGYIEEANFCSIVREWYEAEDSPAITSSERVCRRLRLKDFILMNVDFGRFPPYTSYINGFTRSSFEGFLQRIDTTIQLYTLSKSGTYNARAVSSLVNETFFGELSSMEATRLGCPKAISIPRLISTVTELLHYRCGQSDR